MPCVMCSYCEYIGLSGNVNTKEEAISAYDDVINHELKCKYRD
jgi:hypothetical protein